MKVGDIVKLQHGNAKVVFVDKKEVLLDCDNTDDGEFYMSAKAGYVPKRYGRRLKWMKKKRFSVIRKNPSAYVCKSSFTTK